MGMWVAKFIKGTGTQSDPFNARVRQILRLLIKEPRLVPAEIIDRLKGKSRGITALSPSHIKDGALAGSLRFRVNLQPRIHSEGAGTSFVFVHLKQKGNNKFAEFETQIATISGVIEWDLISGATTDYLIRVAAPPGKSATLRIVEAIESLPAVREAWTPTELVVWRSGIVDNFEPDHFLMIEDESSAD